MFNITPINIEIVGHKAKIVHVSGKVALPPWREKDCIDVFIRLEESLDGIAGFTVELPVKEYSKEEFIDAVIEEGAKVLSKSLKEHRAEREERLQREEKQQAIDKIVNKIKEEFKR